jgi:hypothetical protein
MSSTAAASPRGSRHVSDVGVAPTFHTAKVVSKNKLLLGSPDGDEIAGLDALGGERTGSAVGVALELRPGERRRRHG